jgi:hypothetical protein
VTGPTQENFGLLGKGIEIFGAAESVTSLRCRSPTGFSDGDSDFDSWSSGSEGLLSPFARMNEESSEEDLDFFVGLDVSEAESRMWESSSRVPLIVVRSKRRVGVPKRRLGITSEPSKAPRGVIA